MSATRPQSPICNLQFAICNLFLVIASSLQAAELSPLKVTITNGPTLRELPVIRFDLPAAWRDQTFDVVELRGDAASCPVQRDGDAVLWRANKPIPPNESITFELRENPHVESRNVVSATVDEQGVTLAAGDQRIVQYNVRTVDPPKGADPLMKRSGHLHPVWTPAGRVVTDEMPEDHLHQRGIFSAWVNTTFDEKKTDFWNLGGGTGRTVHKSLDGIESGPVFAEMRATLDHQALENGANPRSVLVETMTIRAYAPPRSNVNVFDVAITQQTATATPLKVLKYHYGGFAIRGAKEWFGQKESDYLTSEGKTKKEGNETRPGWVTMHGLIDGQPCDIAIIPHPASFRYPQPARLHPSKPYFVYSPPVLGEFQITQDQPYAARYRIVAHDGAIDAKLLDQLAAEYAHELTATP